MGSILNPYIQFDGEARAALEFYQSVFGGTLNLNTFGESGMPDSPDADKLMHGQLTTDKGFTVMAADTPMGMDKPAPSSNITISLSGDDTDELRGYWDKLSDGGQVAVPLEQQMWGDTFGMLVDRFGTAWMVNIAGAGQGADVDA
ncbi:MULTISPECIES: VOC family protein [unclassified Janibacter]|uniref:VOC family protein n=1 Tax=unclassified Janibacter TaxID=2649294 RepID=UPI003D008B21